MSAELVLAVVGTIDGCVKLAKKALAAYRAFRDADEGIDEKLTIVEAMWTRLEIQLTFLSRVSNYLNEQLAQSQYLLLQKLHGKLVEATSQLGVSESMFLRKLKYSYMRERLEDLIKELETWQKRFDPTWYLIILIASSSIDSELGNTVAGENENPLLNTGPLHNLTALRHAIRPESQSAIGSSTINSSVNLDEAGLVNAAITAVPYSSARIVVRKGSSKMLIAESVELVEGDISQIKRLVENLAKRLKHVDTRTFCLLQCYGILKRRDPTKRNVVQSIDMIYQSPEGSKPPVSLRQHLLERENVSISARVKMAKQLAQAVLYVHTCDFVHKGIRPENILVFPEADVLLGRSFLVGFNQFREAHFQTNLRGDSCWHRNLYRHPQRQGKLVVDRYVMQHDIYSLGVCLLEIGLWCSFVWYANEDSSPVPGLALKMNMSDQDFEHVRFAAKEQTKMHLMELARQELPHRVGDIYTSIVLDCLGCLDEGNQGLGSEEELTDEDGVLVGVKFVEKVVIKLEDISV